MKHRLAAIAQLLLGLALLALVARHLDRSGELQHLGAAFQSALIRWPLLLLGFAGFGVCLFVCALRWQIILRAQQFDLPFRRTTTLYLIGQFFNAFMLGATGGDLVKALYVARETHHQKTEIVTSIFIERAFGLLAIIALAPLSMLLRRAEFWNHPGARVMLLIFAGLLLTTVVGLLVIFGGNRFEQLPFLRRLGKSHRIGDIIRRVYDAFHMTMRHRGLLTRAILLSALNHLAFVASACAFGHAAGLSLGVTGYLAAFFAINLASAIPITPSGIGTRETAALVLLGALGVPDAQAVTVSLMLYGTLLAWSLIGGIVYGITAFRSQKPRS